MPSITDFIEATQQEGCETRLLQALARFCEDYGYDRVIYSLLTDHASIGMAAQHALYSSYPPDWVQYYIEAQYLSLDPVVRLAKALRWPFLWSRELQEQKLSSAEQRVMHEAKAAGLTDGIGMTVEHLPGEIAGLAMATSETAMPAVSQEVTLIFLAFQQTHRRYCEIQGTLFRTANLPRLSGRELEILRWAAEGKSQLDIADILGIGKSTVSTYLERCMKKLGAGNLIGAVLAASRLGLINPQGYGLLKPLSCRAIADRKESGHSDMLVHG